MLSRKVHPGNILVGSLSLVDSNGADFVSSTNTVLEVFDHPWSGETTFVCMTDKSKVGARGTATDIWKMWFRWERIVIV